jgi:hypothetical protein
VLFALLPFPAALPSRPYFFFCSPKRKSSKKKKAPFVLSHPRDKGLALRCYPSALLSDMALIFLSIFYQMIELL